MVTHSIILPTVDGAHCSWILPRRFTEEYGVTCMGNLVVALEQSSVRSCCIDMSNVEWADPLALLFLAGTLARSSLKNTNIVVDLGLASGRAEHSVFLKFLSGQGFLRTFRQYNIYCDGEHEINLQHLMRKFSIVPYDSLYKNADCIHAKIIDIKEFEFDQRRLHRYVERIIKEAHKRAIQSAFGADPFARDRLFQKTRKLIQELTQNVVEHAYDSGPHLIGIYARIREPKPKIGPRAAEWQRHLNDTIRGTPGLTQFEPNPFSEWLELFICDLGRGLTADLGKWRSDNPKTQAELKAAAAKKKPLFSLWHVLFRQPVSKEHRHDNNRTPVTGLQHLGHVLAFGKDYCRVYADQGAWIGGHFPWPKEKSGSKYAPLEQKDRYPSECIAAPGTAFAFYIQPSFGNVDYPEDTWVVADASARSAIIDALTNEKPFDPNGSVLWFDKRDEQSCVPTDPVEKDSPEFHPDTTVIVRPPRLVTKLEMGKWVAKLAGQMNQRREWHAATLIIAELTPFQALMFAEFFKLLRIHRETDDFAVYLVSEQWATACLTVGYDGDDRRRLVPDQNKARSFLLGEGGNPVSAAHLAQILREEDSKVFWHDSETAPASAFFRNAAVYWSEKITLSRYLDLSQALLESSRYRACRRALRRCLELYRDVEVIPSDDLVASLVKDAVAGTYRQPNGNVAPDRHVVVGSICVSANTVRRFKQRADLTVENVVHLLVHADAEESARETGLKALLWIDPDILPEEKGSDARRELARIPGTPYVAEGGERALSVVRFKRQPDGCIDYSAPFYGRSPDEMYREFRAYGALKLGHWTYGSRHDLLTLNIGFAFEYSVLEKGDLYWWLLGKFKDLFTPAESGGKALAQVLVYPSHAVTDTVMSHIKDDENFRPLLPSGGTYPIKFLGVRTVSPGLASPMIASQIRRALVDRGQEKWSAVIIDDATISGKHERELTQFLEELGAETVYTIAIIDRTGLPVNEGVMSKYMEQHHRYWRWDVPSLGHKRDCALCRALGISHTYADRTQSPRQGQRLKAWREQWSAVDTGREWYEGGVSATTLHVPFEIHFGVDLGANGEKRGHPLHLSDSTSLASLLVELSRMTTRTDVALDRARTLDQGDELKNIPTNPLAAIEIVASQLLLFLDELDYWQKIERFCHLLDFMWRIAPEGKITALSALCLTLVEEELIEEVWTHCQKNLLTAQFIANVDTVIAINILRSLRRFWTRRDYTLASDAGLVERQNYILLDAQPAAGRRFRSRLGDCFALVGDRDGASHVLQFRSDLDKLGSTISLMKEEKNQEKLENHQKNIRYLALNVIPIAQRLVDIFDDIDLECLFINRISGLDDCINKIRKSIELLSGDEERKATLTQRQRGVSLLHQAIFEDTEGSLRSIISRQFLREVKGKDLRSKFVKDNLEKIRHDWSNIVSEKYTNEGQSVWTDRNGGIIPPKIFCGDDTEWGKPFSAYYDQLVRQAIHDAFVNVVHASDSLRNPWDPDDRRKAHMWWRASVDGHYLTLELMNASESRVVRLRPSLGIAGLERIGGSISIGSETDSNTINTRLRIPLSTTLIGEV